MPKRRYPASSGYSRRPAKRQRKATPAFATAVPRGMSIPGKSSTAVILNYTDMNTFNGAAGTTAGRTYRLNSLFDPDQTGAGQQPSGFDQYAALYTRYTVFKAEVDAFFSASDASTITGSYSAGIFASNSAQTALGLVDALARSDKLVFGAASGGGQTTQRIRMSYYLPSIAGRRYSIGDPDYSADVSTNPDNDVFLRVWAGGADDTVDPAAVRCLVRIRFYAVFSEPKSLDES